MATSHPTGLGTGDVAEHPPGEPLLSSFISDYVNELMTSKLVCKGDATPPKSLKDVKDDEFSPGPKGVFFAKKSLDFMIPMHPLHDEEVTPQSKIDAGVGSGLQAGVAKPKPATFAAESSAGTFDNAVSCSLLFHTPLQSEAVVAAIPRPPPLPLPRPPTRLTFHTYAGQRTPTFLFRQKIKQLRLAWPREDQDWKLDFFDWKLAKAAVALLGTACAIRHIPRRVLGDAPPSPVQSRCSRDLERRLEGGGVPGEISLYLWMDTAVSESRYECSQEVMGACLEYLSLYLTFCARTSHPVDLPLLLSSALLPAIEENLAVGIEDMEGGASLFSTTLELVHAAALLPAADARALLGGIPGGYTPPQRKAVRQLCDEADALVAQYLASLSGHACSAREEDPPEEEEASRFQAVQHVASAVRANFPP
eukprot:CAMPEP_0180216902 /NCGR_PEP_ID=MMETSP0987-20121128/16566_1 /TAXON_ID=697907 /ORGANISM="non described non described, Strain CCMP2293" /LENGTH=421 /DNA_ID=CAMNT_0022176237 /DNA_START=27 /DNA_END=1288 /DNA_ORIENTATION=+